MIWKADKTYSLIEKNKKIQEEEKNKSYKIKLKEFIENFEKEFEKSFSNFIENPNTNSWNFNVKHNEFEYPNNDFDNYLKDKLKSYNTNNIKYTYKIYGNTRDYLYYTFTITVEKIEKEKYINMCLYFSLYPFIVCYEKIIFKTIYF